MIKLLWRSVPCSHTGLHNKAMSAARIKRSCDRKLLEAAAKGGKGVERGWRGSYETELQNVKDSVDLSL